MHEPIVASPPFKDQGSSISRKTLLIEGRPFGDLTLEGRLFQGYNAAEKTHMQTQPVRETVRRPG